MSNININQLPLAIGIDGSEYFPLTQGGVTKRASVALLATQPGTGLTGTDGYFLTGQGDGVSPVYTGFQQTGSTVTRTWSNRGQDTKCVLDWIPPSEVAAIRNYTSTTDLTSYINQAIAAVAANPGGRLWFPAGLYPISSTIGQADLRNIIICGDGGRDLRYLVNSGTVIKYTGTGSGTIMNMQEHRGVIIEHIQFVYTSASFTGTCFDCSTTINSGNGSMFRWVQFYNPNAISTASRVWYLRNNVDVTFEQCYVAHATNGWVGLTNSDGAQYETNVIRLVNCTSIALGGHAVVNPFIGWSMVACNFELGIGGIPSGIVNTAAKSVTNLCLYACDFADATTAGTWIDMQNVFNFSMIGGAIIGISLGNSIYGIKIGGAFNTGINIQGVHFGTVDTGIEISATTNAAMIEGNVFATVTTPFVGSSFCDAGCRFAANNPDFAIPLPVSQGGTGVTTKTGTGSVVLSNQPTVTGNWQFSSQPYFNNGMLMPGGSAFFTTDIVGGNIALVTYNTRDVGESVGFTFQDNDVTKWAMYKSAFDYFVIYDFVNFIDALTVVPGATTVGHVNVGYTTASTSPTTGSLINAGGMGNAGAYYGGGAIVSTSATAGVGYATGSGGTVTQSTNKSTGVTLNKVTGTITLNNASLAASTTVGFTLTNSAIAATDVPFVAIKSGATADAYTVQVTAVAAGSCRIELRNTSGSPLSEAVVLSFVVFKGVAA